MRLVLLLLIALGAGLPATGQSAHRLLRQGDASYNQESFQAAEESYRKALQQKPSTRGAYNLGNAIYRQERFDEAVRRYEEAAEQGQDANERASAYHNLGNAYYQMQDFEKSVDAYKESLRLQPQDMQTKYNLALAQNQLRLQQQQQQQQQQSSEETEQQDERDEQQQQQEQQQNAPPQDPSDEGPQPQPTEETGEEERQLSDLTREEARKLLDIMEQEERKVQEKIRKADAVPTRSGKDW